MGTEKGLYFFNQHNNNWQRELPASQRDRGPKVSRERVKLEFDAQGISIPFPQRDVHLDDFWIDRTPVTNAECRSFFPARQ